MLAALGGLECADGRAPSGLQSRPPSGAFLDASALLCEVQTRTGTAVHVFPPKDQQKEKNDAQPVPRLGHCHPPPPHRKDPSRLHPGSLALLAAPLQDPGPCRSVVTACASCSPHMCIEQESGELCTLSSTSSPPWQEVSVFGVTAGCPVRPGSPASPRAQLRLPQLHLPCASSVSPSSVSHTPSSVSPSSVSPVPSSVSPSSWAPAAGASRPLRNCSKSTPAICRRNCFYVTLVCHVSQMGSLREYLYKAGMQRRVLIKSKP